MLSILTGCCQGPKVNFGAANRWSACADLSLTIAALVVGILGLLGVLNIPPVGYSLLLGGGTLLFLVLANKNIKPATYALPEE